MQTQLELEGKTFIADLNKPLPIGIPLRRQANPNCYNTEAPELSPVRSGEFVGSIKEGGAVNHFTIKLAPHGNGTHTECSGHIYNNDLTIEQVLTLTHFPAQVVSLTPEVSDGGKAITVDQIAQVHIASGVRALALRTLPNDIEKLAQNYSGTNPPFISVEAMQYIVDKKIEHLIVDLPSVDPEVDGGKLLAHKTFWTGYDRAKQCTITELAYIPKQISDGLYLLNLQVLKIQLDASPANPVLYALKTI